MTTPNKDTTANASSPFSAWKIDHAAIRVPDFDTAIAWYTGTLGFRLIKQVAFAGLTFAFLSTASDDSFIFELLAGPGAEKRPTYTDLHDSYRIAGWHHVCFSVASVDEAVEQLRQRGVAIISEPHDVVPMRLRVAFFADPWGNLFEVTESLVDRS
jgi:glyoxylase I family protein